MSDQNNRIQFLQDALRKLSSAVKEVTKGLIDLDKVISRISGKTREFAKEQQAAAQSLNRVGKNLKDTSKTMDEYGKNTDKASKSQKGFFSGLGRNIKTIISFYGAYQVLNLAISAFRELVVGSIKRAIDLEKSLGDLAAVADLTSSEVDRLKKVVFDVAGVTSLTSKEIVSLQKELAKLGSSVDEIERLTEPVALLAQALGEEPGGVAATLKKTLNQFQATSEEASQFANILTGAVNETALNLNDLGTALGYVGPLGAQMGVSFEETAALLGILADNGFKASKAGTGLRSFFIAAAKDGRPFNEFLEDIGSRSLDATEAVQVFGKIAASQALVLGENVEKFKELSKELGESDRLFRANAKQMSTTQGQLDLLSSAYDKFSANLGEAITQTNFFINLIAILDKEASGLAGAYKIISKEAKETKEVTDELIGSLRQFSEGSDNPITDAEALSKAIKLVGEEGDFSKSTIDETYKLLLFYLKQGKDLQEAFAIASEKTGRGQLRLLTTTREFVNLMYEQSKGLDQAYISQQANNEVVARYREEYQDLLSLTKEGVEVEKEKSHLQKQINIDVARYSNELAGLRSNQVPTQEELERIKILEKRIALLNEQSINIGKLSVSEETLADKRKKAEKEEKKRIEDDKKLREQQLKDAIRRIKEQERIIKEELSKDISDEQFLTQVELLNSIFGDADKIISEAEKIYGEGSDFVQGLKDVFAGAAQEVAVGLPQAAKNTMDVTTSAILSTIDFIKNNRDLFSFEDLIIEGIERTADAIDDFAEVRQENFENEQKAKLDALKRNGSIEDDILRAQLDNQLITESQFRAKKLELQRSQIAKENSINKQIFDSQQKQDRIDAATDLAIALASIIPNMFKRGEGGEPVTTALKAKISAGLAAASFAAEVAAINSRKFVPKQFEQGGMVSGPSHAEGGVPFSVQGRGGYEMEGGEFIVNKRATSMHRDLLERINNSQRVKPIAGAYKFAQGGLVNARTEESVDYLKAIAEATTSTAIQTSKPVRAFISGKDLRSDETERRLRDRNDRI